LEKISRDSDQTQLFIETPYRNDQLLAELIKVLHPHTRLYVACDITLPSEYIATKSAADWKNTKLELHKRPAIFIVHG